MEKEMQHIYQEIADTVNQMIPEEWEKFYFYAQISETGGGTYFYYTNQKDSTDYEYIHEIPFNFTVNDADFTEKRRHLFDLADNMLNVFKKYDQELWYSFTMSLESSGKFTVHYDYTDWFETDYSFGDQKVIWKYKYLGTEPSDPEKQKVIERYFEEYPNDPI